ncbi:MAG: hypothetical protein GY794_17985 [bacterium]|nr:hypothetical protein [bacterium]
MKRLVLLGLTAGLLMSTGGCISRAAKEALLSPKGFTVPIKMVAANQNMYSKVQFQAFGNSGITTMPADMNEVLHASLVAQVAELDPEDAILDPTANRTVLVRGQYLYYEEAGGILDQAFGPFEEIIAMVELVDQPTGKVIAKGYCVGRTGTTRLQGPRRKAEGMSKAIIELIEKSCKIPVRPE